MKGLALTHHLAGVRASIAAVQTANAALAASLVEKDAQIATLQAENAALKADLETRAQVDEARWVLEHFAWPDGRPITPAEKSAAADVLRADRVARTRDTLGGPDA